MSAIRSASSSTTVRTSLSSIAHRQQVLEAARTGDHERTGVEVVFLRAVADAAVHRRTRCPSSAASGRPPRRSAAPAHGRRSTSRSALPRHAGWRRGAPRRRASCQSPPARPATSRPASTSAITRLDRRWLVDAVGGETRRGGGTPSAPKVGEDMGTSCSLVCRCNRRITGVPRNECRRLCDATCGLGDSAENGRPLRSAAAVDGEHLEQRRVPGRARRCHRTISNPLAGQGTTLVNRRGLGHRMPQRPSDDHTVVSIRRPRS